MTLRFSQITKPILLLAFLLIYFPFNLLTQRVSGADPSLVIGVAEWRYEGGDDKDIQETAYQQLLSKIQDVDLEEVELVKLPVSLESANQVDQIATDYGVDILLWGWYDDVATRSYVDLANATQPDGLTNSLDQFLKNGGSPDAIRVLKILSGFDYYETGLYFCVPRWSP